jgi:DNA repair protein RadC
MNLYELKKIQVDLPKVKIESSKGAADFIRQFYGDDIEIYESFFVLMLNRALHTIGYAKISQGGVAGTVVDVRIVAKYAVDSLCSAIILAHNHPSGNLNPSPEDLKITERTKNALSLFDIRVTDHVILTADGYYSFADDGRL